MADSLTEKTIGRIPGVGKILSNAILDARRAKRQEKDQDRQDKIRDKEEALLDDLRTDFERRQKKSNATRQGKSRVEDKQGSFYESDFDFPAPARKTSGPSFSSSLGLLDEDLSGSTAPSEPPIKGKLPSSLRPRPGEVLRKNSSPLGLVMVHNDLQEIIKNGGGGGKGGKGKAAEGEEGDMITGLISKFPQIIAGLAAAGAITALVLAVKGKLDENQKVRDTNAGQAGQDFLKQNSPDLLNKDFSKSSDAERMKAVKALQAKIDAQKKGFMMQARYNVSTGKVDVDTSKINDYAGTGTSIIQNESASKEDRYKAAADSTYKGEEFVGHRGEDQDANDKQIEALAKQALGEISKAQTSEDIDLTSMKEFSIRPNGDGTYTFTNYRTNQSVVGKLSDMQKKMFGERYIKKHANFLSDQSRAIKWSLNRKEPLSKNKELNRFEGIDSMSVTDLMQMEYGINKPAAQYNPLAVFDLITSAKDPKNIPMFHHGGIAQHEMPAILRRDETVLNPSESKVYAQQKISELEGHQIGAASGVNQEEVVAAIEKLISVLEAKDFEPKINFSSRGGEPPVIDFNGMRTV